LGYAKTLDLPFVFSTNGDGFVFHDRTIAEGVKERELGLHEFPTPAELWARYCAAKKIEPPAEPIVTQDFYSDGSDKSPRYYQLNAINRVIEAAARGENRVLLVMATGTGKTYTAFQIIWRLWKAGKAKRILFLADRNNLVDQTKTNDFKPFGKAMTKITKRQVDKSYEIYLALYQAITGPDEAQKIYKQFSPDFFDLVVVDECHRGSAAEESAWREVLEYFGSAMQVGMTATPKETRFVSNIDYFGKPAYTYSLKEGIEDGFLAPYKVVRIDIDKDLAGWRPSAGKRDKHDKLIPDRVYNQRDFDKTLVIDQRTELVAKKITEFLKGTNRYDKTIVFCEDIDHASRMRQALVNENADLVEEDDRYIMQITGDNDEGKRELDNFIMPESRYPVIATTSKLMTTGVDAKTCKLVVIDQRIESMIEFKQIIGRGTRIEEEYGKLFFTIMDFRKATELFADPDFDGPPIQVYEPGPDDPPVPPDDDPAGETPTGEPEPMPEPGDGEVAPGETGDGGTIVDPLTGPGGPGKRVKYVVNDVPVWIVSERVQYYGDDGKLITESLKDYSRKGILRRYASLSDFLTKWRSAEQKQAVIEELERQGIIFEALAEEVGKDFDPFDLVCHVAFGQPPLTRRERAENVRKRNYFGKYAEQARAVLNALLDKYADEGIVPIEDMAVLKVQPLPTFGTPTEIVKLFGGKEQYLAALRELGEMLYKAAA
jgi:type I restriction enzyme R subunit